MSKELKDYLFYQDDWATIYCGDCLLIMPLMDPESVDLVVTDPPYNVGKDYGFANDSLPNEEYYRFIQDVFQEINLNDWKFLTHIPKKHLAKFLTFLPKGQIIIIERKA